MKSAAYMLLSAVLAIFLMFQHNPVSWKSNLSELPRNDVVERLGKSDAFFPDTGNIEIWVSGTKIWCFYLFPTFLKIGYDDEDKVKNVGKTYFVFYYEGMWILSP